MTRVNLILMLLLVVFAMGAVTAQHKARKLHQGMESERERGRALEVEFDQLQIEQSTWAVHTRIEKVALERLKMHRPAIGDILRPHAEDR